MDRVSLHIPTEAELEYRRYLIADEDTMAYNLGYGDHGGCTYHQSPEQIQQWYKQWNKDNRRFYAYIVRTEDRVYIGEVNARRSNDAEWYEMGIIVESKYRGRGYAVEALKLLLKYAFDTLGAEAVHNDFEEARAAAVKTHLAAGFSKYKRHNGNIELLITKEQFERQNAIGRIASSIRRVLSDSPVSIYLYGSVVLEDFRLGWSDIDILCLTEKPIPRQQADELVLLRQKLLKEEPDNQYYRLFEGGMLTLNAFLNQIPDCVVYWGTSGQRIADRYHFDSFSMAGLIKNGKLICGDDVRRFMKMPSYEMLYQDVKKHYETIKKHAITVSRSIKSYGWLLDIARCIYTLRTGAVTAKTAAGEWALKNDISPVREALETAVMIRKEPLKFMNDEHILNGTLLLGEKIQMFADVLEAELQENLRNAVY